MAKHIRYFRGVLSDGRIAQRDILETCLIRLGSLRTGGYPAQARRLPSATRDMVRARAGGQCQICGAPGTEIDHLAGDSAVTANLRLLCASCHRHKTLDTSLRLAATPLSIVELRGRFDQHVAQQPEVARRVFAGVPERWCDCDGGWDRAWRSFLKATQQAAARSRRVENL